MSRLRSVSDRLRSCLRKSDIVARLGGDEFAILQSDVSQHAECETLATRIIETVSKPYNLAGNEATIGVSIGIAIAPSDGTDQETLLQKADIALYAAKGTIGFMRLGEDYGDDEETRWTSFGLKSDKAMQAAGLAAGLAGQLVGATKELHSNVYVSIGAEL